MNVFLGLRFVLLDRRCAAPTSGTGVLATDRQQHVEGVDKGSGYSVSLAAPAGQESKVLKQMELKGIWLCFVDSKGGGEKSQI